MDRTRQRDVLWLNGEWDFMPYYGEPNPQETLPETIRYEKEKVCVPSSWRGFAPGFHIEKYDFAPMDVFAYPKQWAQAEAGLLHRMVTVPKEWRGRKVFLQFDGIFQKSVIWLGGQKLGTFSESFLPIRLDITQQANFGKTQDLFVQCASFDTVTIPSGAQKVTAPNGNWFGRFARGIWQDVKLEAVPVRRVEDIELIPSVRKGQVEARVCLKNDTEIPFEGRLTHRVREWKSGREVWKDSQPVRLSAGQSYVICWKRLWTDAVLWSPQNPFLYVWEAHLTGKDGTEDKKEQRFGFREFWIEGSSFYLNGIPVKLRGDSWHFQGAVQQTKEYAENWYRICRMSGINSVRLHAEPHPTYYLDAADEMGMLIVDETAIHGSGKAMDASNPVFLDNCRRHVRQLVRRDRNHPSVVIWSLENEMRWVDGRDEYKRHIPELMGLMHEEDHSGRPISLDGDNRLISREDTEIASLHYNIDGTIGQWDRKVPLTIGEHGGHWYLCPQNASMYGGIGVYLDSEFCCRAVALKEKMFLEYARRMDVSGISSFNFAHYFAVSMPGKDIELPEPKREGRQGVYPRVIRKYSMTIGNGVLESYGYPFYQPNPAYPLMEEAMRPVTAIVREYNRSFYDDRPLVRTFDIYHDVLYGETVKMEWKATQAGCPIAQGVWTWDMEPAAHVTETMTIMPRRCSGKPEELILRWKLWDGNRQAEEKRECFSVYPRIGTALSAQEAAEGGASYAVEAVSDPTYYVPGGEPGEYDMLCTAFPDLRLWDGGEIPEDGCLIIVGSHQSEDTEQAAHWDGPQQNGKQNRLEYNMELWAEKGHPVLCLAQHAFAFGPLELERKHFLGAYPGCFAHPLLEGMEERAFFCWNGEIEEAGPVPDFAWAYRKTADENLRFPLECGYGDFGDGGDLWAAVVEYRRTHSNMLFCQLELARFWKTVPQAMEFLIKMGKYAVKTAQKRRERGERPLYLGCVPGDSLEKMAEETGVFWKRAEVGSAGDKNEMGLPANGCLWADPKWISGKEEKLTRWIHGGGRLLVAPLQTDDTKAFGVILPETLAVTEEAVWQLQTADGTFLRDASVTDAFGMDQVPMCPRKVENRMLCTHTVRYPEAECLAVPVAHTVWEDTFVEKYSAEYCRRSLVGINLEKAPSQGGCALRISMGKGEILLCQILVDSTYDKSVRLYRCVLDALSVSWRETKHWPAEAVRQAVPEWMALACQPWQDRQAMGMYFTDAQYSLNNLGEGLYGWMKHVEKDRTDGFVCVDQWPGRPLFLTMFLYSDQEREAIAAIECSRSVQIWCRGEKIFQGSNPSGGKYCLKLSLKQGRNVICVEAEADMDPLRLFMLILGSDGRFLAGHLWYRLTVDEIDPK